MCSRSAQFRHGGKVVAAKYCDQGNDNDDNRELLGGEDKDRYKKNASLNQLVPVLGELHLVADLARTLAAKECHVIPQTTGENM